MSHEAAPSGSQHNGSPHMAELAGLLVYMKNYKQGENFASYMSLPDRLLEPTPEDETINPNLNVAKIHYAAKNKVQ